MKYTYRPVIPLIVNLGILALIMSFFYVFYKQKFFGFFSEPFIVCLVIGFLIYDLIYSMRIYTERYVLLKEDAMHYHRPVKSSKKRPLKNDVDFNIYYDAVYYIKYKRIPFGFDHIVIYDHNAKNPFKLTFAVKDHRQLFSEFALKVRRANPEAIINEKLFEL